MRSDTAVPVEDPWLSSQQEQQGQIQDLALLRRRALSLARALSSSSSSSPSSFSSSLATDVEVLASQVAALPPVGENELLAVEEGWLVAAVADLRARVRSLSVGGSDGGGKATATETATATAAKAAAPASFASALSQRFERTTLKFFMPGSASACVSSRRLRLELGKTMTLAG